MTAGGVAVHPLYGMTTADLKNLAYRDEPFILAKDVTQVFYFKDMCTRQKRGRNDKSVGEPKRHIILSGKRSIVGIDDKLDMSEDYEMNYEIPPFAVNIDPCVRLNSEGAPWLRRDHNQGTYKDELTYALETPQHPGRTRGVGVVPWKVGFPAHADTYRSRKRKKDEETDQLRIGVGLEVGHRDPESEPTVDVSPTQHRSNVASTEVPEDEDVLRRYPVDDITEATPCELHTPAKNLTILVANGIQREGTNLCAFYVVESIMSRGQRTYSALSDLKYRRVRVAEEDKHKTIQEALACFLNDEVLDPKGEHYYDGRLEPASIDYNIDLDDPNFD
uniref:Uncharacterized protein n=1 Tax=Leersia perrieri TaxID=77586 RepID=A0A0D9WGK0_9ORYZ